MDRQPKVIYVQPGSRLVPSRKPRKVRLSPATMKVLARLKQSSAQFDKAILRLRIKMKGEYKC